MWKNIKGFFSDWHHIVLMILASQYLILQLILGVEYWDGPRNLHWSILIAEQPRFLLDSIDGYNRIFGFPPDPPYLASIDFSAIGLPRFHHWWGPVYLGFIGLAWKLTHSYTVIQIIVPILSGGVVLLTYAFGKRFYNKQVGLLAAFLLSIFPIFREHAVLTFVEPISALLLLCAFWAFLTHKTLWTIIFGSLAMLGKIDNIIIYGCTILLIFLLHWFRKSEPKIGRHVLLCLGLPFIAVGPWLYLTYFLYNRDLFNFGTPNFGLFAYIFPLALEQLFVMHISITVLTLLVIVLTVVIGIGRKTHTPSMLGHLQAIWILIVTFVVLVYLATPTASNNPRGIINALPALWILSANGLLKLRLRIRQFLLSYLVAIFLLSNTAGIIYQIVRADIDNHTTLLWETMRDEPKGYVLTEYYWDCILYARQPATWFFNDPQFRDNILLNIDNFISYLTNNPIKYIILPIDAKALGEEIRDSYLIHLYQRLPFGRVLPFEIEAQVTDEVRQYLEINYQKQLVGDFNIESTAISSN